MTDENISHKHLSRKIKDSARQIWLAGLGAYNKAEEDAGKVFNKLVQEGEDIERKTRGVLEKQFKVVEDRVEEVKGRASNTMDKLESVFDERVSKALDRLRIPNYLEFKKLKEEVGSLKERIEELEKNGDKEN
jgi:poly(hydroxyalkanoate) granule-associated protein